MTLKTQKQSSENPQESWYHKAAGMALAVGAGALTSQDATAATVYTDVSNQNIATTGTSGQQSIYFSLFTSPGQPGQVLLGAYDPNPFGGGPEDTPDWTQFILGRYGNWASLQNDGFNNAVGDVAVEVYPNPFNLSTGTVVGAGSPFVGQNWGLPNIQTLAGSSLQYGHFTVPDAGYLGLRFSPDNGQNFYYGWAQIEIGDPNLLPATPANVRLLGFAYNDQLNEPIQVGGSALIPGDANRNGVVDGDDYIAWADHFQLTGQTWDNGDFNLDGTVNGDDYIIWADHFNPQVMQVTAIPEPASMTLLVMGAAGLGAYRAKRRRQKDRRSPQPAEKGPKC